MTMKASAMIAAVLLASFPAFGGSAIWSAVDGVFPNEALPYQLTDTATPEVPELIHGRLALITSIGDENIYYMMDGEDIFMPHTVELRFGLQLGSGHSSANFRGQVGVVFTVGAPAVGNTLYFNNGEIFLLDAGQDRGPSIALDTSSMIHDYLVRISGHGAGDIIEVYQDGVLKLTGAIFNEVGHNGTAPRVGFGDVSIFTSGESFWSYFTHNAFAHPGHTFDVVVSNTFASTFWETNTIPAGVSTAPVDTNTFSTTAGLVGFTTDDTITMGVSTQLVVSGWTRTGSDPGEGPGSNTGPIVLTNDAAVTFHWDRQFLLEVTNSGPGTVTGPGGWQIEDTDVLLTAVPDPGIASVFTGWSGNVPPSAANDNPLLLAIDQARSVTAHFEAPEWTVSVSNEWAVTFWENDGAHAALFLPPSATDTLPASATARCFTTNELIYINTTTQKVAEGWTRKGSAPASGLGSDTGTFAFTNDTVLTYSWETRYWLDVDTLGPGWVDIGAGWFTEGAVVAVSATPHESTVVFAGWSGDVPVGQEKANPLVLTMDRARRVTATFAQPYWDLVVSNAFSASVATPALSDEMLPISTSFPGARGLDVADINNDGRTDVICAAYEGDAIGWWAQADDVGAAWNAHTIVASLDGALSVQAQDMDEDGDVDILGTAYFANDVLWWENADGGGNIWIQHVIASSFDGAIFATSEDIDGDGDQDVLAAATRADQVAWWENVDGSATNWAKHTVNSSFNAAYHVHACDVDGDSDLDVLGAAYLANDITWWENTDGSGAVWLEHVIDGSFGGASFVATTDMDRDGDPDVLGAARAGNTVAWWENSDGNGDTWVEHTVDDAVGGANWAHPSDLDGDGDTDVLGAAFLGDEISWWENEDGLGATWTKHVLAEEFDEAWAAISADIDSDGSLDVLASSSAGGQVAWWKNHLGAAYLFHPPLWESTLPASASLSVHSTSSVVRLNSHTQWVCSAWTRTGGEPASGSGSSVDSFALTNNAWVSFLWDRQFWLNTGTEGPGVVDVQDGWADEDSHVVVTATPDSALVTFSGWTGDVPPPQTNDNPLVITMDRARAIEARFNVPEWNLVVSNAFSGSIAATPLSFEKRWLDTQFAKPTGMHAADIDLDGDTDVVGAAYDSDTVVWWRNLDGRGTQWNTEMISSTFDGPISVRATDMDEDGDRDVLATARLADDICWWENVGGGGSNWAPHIVDSFFDGANFACAADLDGDEDPDVLAAGLFADEIAWWENTDGSATNWTKRPIDSAFAGAYVARAGDLDGDGDLDTVAAAFDADEIAWWENTTGDAKAWSKHSIDASFNGAVYVDLSDVDQDGDMDVLGAARHGSDIAWWENAQGNGTSWVKHIVDTSFGGANWVETADLDLDGDVDVLGAGQTEDRVTWWENADGAGTSWSEHIIAGLNGPWAAVAEDVDGDSIPDVLASSHLSHQFGWWENKAETLGMFPLPLWTNTVAASESIMVYSTGEVFAVGSTTQWVCSGWTRIGSDPGTGAGASTEPFMLTNETAVIFDWARRFLLDTEVEGAGSVDVPDWWIPEGTVTTINATADAYFSFDEWSGDTGGSLIVGSQFITVMDYPRTVTAHFSANLATNDVPEWWLADHGWTSNFDLYALLDPDGDRMLTWEEWVAGTDPTNRQSALRLIDLAPAEGGRLALTFQSVPYRTYTLSAASDLAPGTWSPIAATEREDGALETGPVVARDATTTLYVEPQGDLQAYRLDVQRLVRITGVERTDGGKLAVSYVGTPWNVYVLEASSNAVDGAWTPVPGSERTIPEQEHSTLYPEPDGDAAFYRIRGE